MVPHILSLAPVYICSLAGQPGIRYSIIINTHTVYVGTNKTRAISLSAPVGAHKNRANVGTEEAT